MMEYFRFFLLNRRFLAFGFLCAFFSAFGQTYLVALFNTDIRTEFGLSHGDFGLIYSTGTVASAACLIWIGPKIDRMDLHLYSGLVCAFLIAACFFMATAPSLVLLSIALFAVRFAGQGLMSHTALTSMGRYFEGDRGKAISFAHLGHHAAQAAFPLVTVGLIATLGWRWAWAAFGVGLLVILVPILQWLLRGHGARHAAFAATTASLGASSDPAARQWTQREVLGDLRFYMVIPNTTAGGFIMTGLFFHQLHLVEVKGWSITLFASSFVIFAAAAVVAAILVGPLVDRVRAVKLLPYHQLPFALSLLTLAAFDHFAVAIVFMALNGISMGSGRTISGAVWAELYGVTNLGAIRSMVHAVTVFSTALGPVTMGWLIDLGVSIETIAYASFLYVIGAALLVVLALRRPIPLTRPAE